MGVRLELENDDMSQEEIEQLLEKAKKAEEAEKATLDMDMISNAMIQTIPKPMGFLAIMEGLEKGLFVVPNFQRGYRWTTEQVEQLAISLVRGMPIPPIYGYRNKKRQIVILDGQQRLISLYLYFAGKCIKKKRNLFINTKKLTNSENGFREALEAVGLEDKEYSMTYYDIESEQEKEVDITYANLGIEARREIDFAQINIVIIDVDAEKHKERVMHKVFANLNKGGVPLSPQELRNGIYNCPFYNMLHEINANNQKWRDLYSGKRDKDENKESKDIELLLKLCAFKKNAKFINGELVLQNYKGKITSFLDEFSEEAMSFSEREIEHYKSALENFFDCVESIETKTRETLWPCLFVAVEQREFKTKITKDMCERITSSKDYNKSGTSSKTEIETRLRCVYEGIYGFN